MKNHKHVKVVLKESAIVIRYKILSIDVSTVYTVWRLPLMSVICELLWLIGREF